MADKQQLENAMGYNHNDGSSSRKRRSKEADSDQTDSSVPILHTLPQQSPMRDLYDRPPLNAIPFAQAVMEPDFSQIATHLKKPKTELDLPYGTQGPSLLRAIPSQYVTNFSVNMKNSPYNATKFNNPYPNESIFTPYNTTRPSYPFDFQVPNDRTLPAPNWNRSSSPPPTNNIPPPGNEDLTRRLYPVGAVPSSNAPASAMPPYYAYPPGFSNTAMGVPVDSMGSPYFAVASPIYPDPWYFDAMRMYQSQQQQQSNSPRGSQQAPQGYESSANELFLPTSGNRPNNLTLPSPFTQFSQPTANRFGLLQQPQEVQRKSYKSENRCLLPNPLVVSAVVFSQPMPRIVGGTVTVKLVSQHGTDLPNDKQKLLDSLSGTLTEALDESLCANFSLKLLETSEGHLWRLRFRVRYIADGMGEQEEEFLSRPFVVYSNRRKNQTTKNTAL